MRKLESFIGMRGLLSAVTWAACAWPGLTTAVELETGNPDLKIRWDNTVRYSLGIRARDCDPNICGNGAGAGDITAHQSDRHFGKAGDVITNRFDLLSEFDAVYKDDMGVRVSAAGWYDQAYRDTLVGGDPALLAAGFQAFPTGHYTDFQQRFYRGPSGEFLDAFVFGKATLGDVPVSAKLGQHNVYWGESLFSFVGGVAYGQGPVDLRKAIATPGTEAKELFLPLNQASFSAALTDRLQFMGQYLLDWKPSRLPEGGTYFGPVDFYTQGSQPLITPFGVPFENVMPKDKRGDWGLALKWRPEWLDGTAGMYYRQYTDKLPQLVFAGSAVEADYRTPRQEMLGFSLAKEYAGISFGSDITYRKNAQIEATPLANVTPFVIPGLVGGGVIPGSDWRPRGDVATALVNAIAYVGKTPVFDSASLSAELNYSRLQAVTFDPYHLYFGRTQNCGINGVATDHGCPTKDAWGLAVLFEPKWFQVLPSMDLSMPMFLGVGLKGNSPVPFGDNQGQGSYSIGLSADYYAKYNFTLKFNGFLAKHSQDQLGVASFSNASLGKYWDRNWVSFTFKTTF
jgi:hypothetical protein